jgi:sodium/bile acid cotransporter 7
MLPFLAKRWFLLLLLGGVLVAWLWPDALEWTRSHWVRPQLVMALALFLSAWSMESRSLYEALLRPWAALWASVISYGFLPALGWLNGAFLPIPEDFSIGIMICASVPCTLASAVLWTRMAGGNEATALLTTFITTGLSWFATTAWLTGTTGSHVEINTKAMMADLALILVVPVAVGQLARTGPTFRWIAVRFRKPISVISRLLILVIMLRAALAVSDQLRDQAVALGTLTLLGTAAICIGMHLLALFGGVWTGRLIGFDRPSRIAIAFAGSQKTLPVSLALLDLYFPGYPLAVVPMLFYHAGQLIVDTFIAEQWAADAVGSKQWAVGSSASGTPTLPQETIVADSPSSLPTARSPLPTETDGSM